MGMGMGTGKHQVARLIARARQKVLSRLILLVKPTSFPGLPSAQSLAFVDARVGGASRCAVLRA